MSAPDESDLNGMTVNEKLSSLDLLDQWEEAAQARDRERMIGILSQCAMSPDQCAETCDAVLENPSKYGF